VSLQLKPTKTNTSTLFTLCLKPKLLFLLCLPNKNSLIQDLLVPNNPQLLNLIQDPHNISHIKDHYCCIKLNQSRRSKKATTTCSHQLSPPSHHLQLPAASHQPPAVCRHNCHSHQPPSHLKVEFSCFKFVYK